MDEHTSTQPLLNSNNNFQGIVNNQNAPHGVIHINKQTVDGFLFEKTSDSTFFRSHSVFYKCQYCMYEGPTYVNQSCNVLSVGFFLISHTLWCAVDALKTRDFNCTDATHYCSSCGRVLYYYKAI